MAKGKTPRVADARTRAVRDISGIFAWAVAIQAAAFLAISISIAFATGLLAQAMANATNGAAALALLALDWVIDLVLALVIGYAGARRLLRALVRATPHPAKPATQLIPLAAFCAALLAVAVLVLLDAQLPQSVLGWTIEAGRDAAIVAIFWFSASRVVARGRL